MAKIISISLLAFALPIWMSAGTLFFKDGSSLSGVKIISISDGDIIIEKDRTKKSFGLRTIKAYYSTDIKSATNSTPDQFAGYRVTVFDIKAPKKGVDSKDKTAKFTLRYNISRKGGSTKTIRVPYFYHYILTNGKDEYSRRQVYSYYVPKQAKPKGKGYDMAAILARLNDFSRPVWHHDRENFHGGLMGRKIEFELRGVKDRKVLAWRLEVWGNSKRLYQKTEVQYPSAKVGKKWWKRLKD